MRGFWFLEGYAEGLRDITANVQHLPKVMKSVVAPELADERASMLLVVAYLVPTGISWLSAAPVRASMQLLVAAVDDGTRARIIPNPIVQFGERSRRRSSSTVGLP